LFSASLIGWSVLQGVVALALVAGIFLVSLHRGMPEAEVRALTFFALVLSIVGLIFVNRSFSASIVTAFRRRNVALRWVLPGVAMMLAVTLLVPFAQRMFRFGPLHIDDIAVTIGAGILTIVILDAAKPHWRKRLMT
jgi:Ca2+-transporting ATPase